MVEQDKSTVMPRLRFPEFRDSKLWRQAKLGELGRFTGGGTPSKETPSYWIGANPWISSSDISEESIHDIKVTRYISDTATRETATRLVPANSVLLVSRVGVGKLAVTNKPIYTSQDFTNFTPDNDNPLFVAYYLKSLKKTLLAFNQGMAIKGFTKDNAANLELHLPELGEQQKIADCLTSLDEVITAQGRKVEALKTYKRGLMQQLFPREGETLPRLRFPEFRNAPEWKEVNAGTLFANRAERGDDALPIYSVTMTDGLVKRASLDRRIDDIAEAAGNKKVYRNDIAYNMMRMWQGACGVAREDCMVSPAYVVLAPQKGMRSAFYGYLFKLPQMLRLFTAYSRGLTEDRLRLYYQDFRSISLPQPDVREQERIAACLSALDARVAVESDKLNALRIHKQGLMQQLFPSLDVA